ncbi:MAG TPA: hypothetical protein PLU55_01310 [Candidatus Pacearchaeota archaeon]|nr:hypothetical protein [Candidatus Pacearchaeota archaeon]
MSVGCVKIYEDKIVLGTDSIIVYGGSQEKKKDAKIKKIDENFGFVSTGVVKEIEFFFIFCKTHKPSHNTIEGIIDYFFEFSIWKKKKIDDDKIENTYIIVYEGKSYYFYDYDVTPINDYSAIGAGWQYATTSLYLGHDVEEAIKTACELSIYCELPSNIIEFKKETSK